MHLNVPEAMHDAIINLDFDSRKKLTYRPNVNNNLKYQKQLTITTVRKIYQSSFSSYRLGFSGAKCFLIRSLLVNLKNGHTSEQSLICLNIPIFVLRSFSVDIPSRLLVIFSQRTSCILINCCLNAPYPDNLNRWTAILWLKIHYSTTIIDRS